MRILLFLLCLFAGAIGMRYLFTNTYGDAAALTANPPSDVRVVPFGWTAEAEANRNSILATLGISVSALPCLVYQKAGKWTELRIFDKTSKPWSWLNCNTVIASSFVLSLVGDSLFAQMVGVQASQAAPVNSAQNLAISGTVTSQIATTVVNVSGAATHVVVLGGYNDFSIGNGDTSAITVQIVANYTTMLDAITAAGKIAVVVGIPQVDEAQLAASRPQDVPLINNTIIADVNSRLTALCRSRSNCTPALNAMSMSRVGKTADGIHFTAASYPEWTNSIVSAL